MLIAEVCQALARFEVPYALVGGHAVALHGAVRGTIDFDDPLRQVDLLIHFDLTGHAVVAKATRSGTVQVLNKQDLIAMKRKSGRPQDLEDIRSLEAL
jgi:hypothetical protein